MKTLKLLFACFLVIGLLGMSAQADLIMVPEDYTTIQAAIDAANSGDTIMLAPGNYTGAVIYKKVNIIGTGGASITEPITLNEPAPPTDPVGLYIAPAEDTGNNPDYALGSSGSGSSISNITIGSGVDFILYGIVGIGVDDVSVRHVIFNEPVLLGIHWGNCDGWNVSHNTFNCLDIGMVLGAAPVPLAYWAGDSSNDNLIALNEFNTGGIYMFAAGVPFKNNKVVHNKVKVGLGIAVEDFSWFVGEPNIYFADNLIGFNDLRGCNPEIVDWSIEPIIINNNITISRNLGYQEPNNPNRAVTEPPEDVKKFKPVM